MKTNIKANLNSLQLSDVYSLMLFVLYKLQDVPEYAVLSELCYLLDGANMTRLLTYFAGKTVRIPTAEEFSKMANAMLLYQYINVDGMSLVEAQAKLGKQNAKQKDETVDLYLKLLPVMKQYKIDKGQIGDAGR